MKARTQQSSSSARFGGLLRSAAFACAVHAAQVCGAGAMGDAPPAATPAALSKCDLDVVVTVPALKGIVEPLLPEGSRVTMLMRPGRSEHGYEMTADDVVRIAKADVFVYVGLGLESRVERVVGQRGGTPEKAALGVVGFAGAVGDEKVRAVKGMECTLEHEGHGEHDGHDEHEHDDRAGDPHLWLDPVLVKDLIPAITTEVERCLRARGAWNTEVERAQAAREAAIIARVDALDSEYRDRLAPYDGRSIITHHDAFSRLAKRYGLRVAAVVRVGASGESSPGDLAKVIGAAKESGAKAIFREPQFDAKAAQRLADLAGLKVLTLDPLGDGDWFLMMRKNLDALCEGLGGSEPVQKPGDKAAPPGK